jgi:hypothetical protein
MTTGWGEAESIGGEDQGETLSNGGVSDLAGGHHLEMSDEAFHALLHHPAVVAAVEARSAQLTAAANSMVNLDPRTVKRLSVDGEDAYTYDIHDDPNDTRARGWVFPPGLLGLVDDAANATLWKAMMSPGMNDPIPHGGELEGGELEGAEPEGNIPAGYGPGDTPDYVPGAD